MKLKELKLANPDFFSGKAAQFFGDDQLVIAKEGNQHVLKVFSTHGTKPVYSIDHATKRLTYLRHDCEAAP